MSAADPMSPETRALFEQLHSVLGTHMGFLHLQGTVYVHAARDVVGVLGELLVPIIAAIEDDQAREHVLGLLLKHLPGGVERCRLTMAQRALLSETMQ